MSSYARNNKLSDIISKEKLIMFFQAMEESDRLLATAKLPTRYIPKRAISSKEIDARYNDMYYSNQFGAIVVENILKGRVDKFIHMGQEKLEVFAKCKTKDDMKKLYLKPIYEKIKRSLSNHQKQIVNSQRLVKELTEISVSMEDIVKAYDLN